MEEQVMFILVVGKSSVRSPSHMCFWNSPNRLDLELFTQHIGLVVPIGDLLGLFSGRSDISRCRLGPSSPEPLRTSERKTFLNQVCIKMLLAWASWNRWTHSLTLTLNCSSVSLPWFRYLLASILCTWWGIAVLFWSLATRLNQEQIC